MRTPFPLKLLCQCFLLLLLAACSASSPPVSRHVEVPHLSTGTQEDEIQRNLRLAAISSSPDKETYLLNAAELFLNSEQFTEAGAVLNGIADMEALPSPVQLRYALLRGEVALQQGEADAALELLQSALQTPLHSLESNLQQQVLNLRSRAYYEQHQYIAAVRERILLAGLLTQAELAANNNTIWQILANAPENALDVRGNQIDTYELRGWLELAQVVNAEQFDIPRQVQAVSQWQNKWMQHSAAAELPEALTFVHELWDNRARNIALLLPVSEPAGKAINEGFLGAYYEAMAQGVEVPTITVYDTSVSNEIMPLYRQAVERGADMIIGPLRKELVRQLQSQDSLPVPTLALNYGDFDRISPAGLYQFGLAPEDEIMQAAEMAWQAGHRYAAILIPTGGDYIRISETFASYWQQLGGEVVSQATFSQNSTYTDVIRDLLSIGDSEVRATQLRSLLSRNTIHFTPRRRQDVDFIFLNASPLEGRQIKPTLAFHFAGDVPVYAMPNIYDGGNNTVANRDLNGVMFMDAPWILKANEPLREHMNSIWPASAGPVQRLRAMGVDSFRLYARIAQLEAYPQTRLHGATGMLSMQSNGGIKRELLEAQIINGNAALLESRPQNSNTNITQIPRP